MKNDMVQPYQTTPPEMSVVERELWQMLIQERCGLQFNDGRLSLLRQRLWKRMQVRRLLSYSDYYHYVTFNSEGQEEWQMLQALLLNHETSFFRHPTVLEALTKHLLPTVIERKIRQGVGLITLWSAGCSTGQEPYSMAMVALEWLATLPPPVFQNGGQGWHLKISGSDISREALQKARQGRYKPHELRYLPDEYRSQYLKRIDDGYQIVGSARSVVQFGYVNLLDPATFWVMSQDVIFCQNVLIYFKPEDRRKIVNHLLGCLAPGGYLVTTPATTDGLQLKGVQRVSLPDVLVYQRTSEFESSI